MIRTAIVWLLLLPAPAVRQDIEGKAREIEGKLMAPCCWSSTIAQHYSQAADEMRSTVRAMLAAGKSEQQILDYWVALYGERILASPPARGFNLLAWVLPGIALIAGVVFVILLLRRWSVPRLTSAGPASPPVSLDKSILSRVEKELQDLD